MGGKSPKSSIAPKMVRAKAERPRAKERTAKGKAREMAGHEEATRAVDPQRADVLSAGGSTGPPSAPKMLSRREAASPRPGSKGAISRRR